MENEKLLTIVVPIYNVERYLRQCLDSLLYQTVDNHFVIMVNDGSKDSSGEIAKEYADKYPEIFRYIEQENAGLGAARNTGLRLVETEMVGFLDSDDWVPANYIERLTKRIELAGVLPDILYTLPCVFDCATNRFQDWMDKPLLEELFSEEGKVLYPKEDFRIMGLEPTANRKLYRIAFLHQINFAFPTGTKWEDVEPHFEQLHLANCCIAERNTGFIYRINSGGQITASVGSDRLQIVSVFSRALEKARLEEWTRTEINYIIRMMFSFSRWSISFSNNEVRRELVGELHKLYRSITKQDWNNYFADFGIGRKDRLYIWLIKSRFFPLLANPVRYDRARFFLKKFARRLKFKHSGGDKK